MINFSRQQLLLEPWQVLMVEEIAEVKDCSLSKAVRYMICFVCLNLRAFTKLRTNYADLSFEARKVYEKRYKK